MLMDDHKTWFKGQTADFYKASYSKSERSQNKNSGACMVSTLKEATVE
jgi:hypothetical protein